jgi:hypothetical protein
MSNQPNAQISAAQGKRIDGFGVSCILTRHPHYPEIYTMATTYTHGGETIQRYEIIPAGTDRDGVKGLAFELFKLRMTEYTVTNWDYIYNTYSPITEPDSTVIRWVADLFRPQNIPALYDVFKSANTDFFRSNNWQNVLITHQCMIMGYDARTIPYNAFQWMVYILTERGQEFRGI